MFRYFQMFQKPAVIGVSAAVALLASSSAHAATAMMIWPVDPVIESDQRGAAVWLENRDNKPVTLQTRVVGWDQQDYAEKYDQNQKDIAISPPMVTVQPGQRQLIRLIRLAEPAPRSQKPYRVLISEIPNASAKSAEDAEQVSIGVELRMQYSLPLFVYGNGLRPKSPANTGSRAAEVGSPDLTWHLDASEGKQWLVVSNRGPVHARLTRLDYLVGDKRVDESLLDYVLPGASMRWALPEGVNGANGLRVLATVNGEPEVPINSAAGG